MARRKTLMVLIVLIWVLAAFAAGMGLFFDTAGESYAYTNHRGEAVWLYGHGLYRFDTVSAALQAKANDLTTLVVGIPLLVIAAVWYEKGSLRGKLLLTGTLGFFLYTYMSMAMLSAYNALFLVYVALFGLSMYAFILAMMDIDLSTLPERFSEKLPRKWIVGVLLVVGLFLAVAWLGRIVPPLLNGSDPVLENATTLVIQVMDLVLIVPAAVLGGVLLLKRKPWGYLLSAVVMLKALTMGIAVSAMGINMRLHGVMSGTEVLPPFIVITVVNAVLAVLLLKSVKE